MRSRPAHGGFPGEVVVERLPATTYDGLADGRGFVPLGAVWVHVDALRALPIEQVANAAEIPVEELREWADGPARPLGLWREERP